MTDVTEQMGAVRRTVGTRVLEAGEARVVTLRRTFDAPIDDLWDACTNAERIPRWFLPVSGDLRVGGRYQFEGNAGGTIERCEPPTTVGATWEYGGDVSWVELRLVEESAERTRFELEHVAHVDDARWAEFGPGAVGVGWDLGLLGLARHLGADVAVDPAEAMAWMASEEGRRCITISSEAWRDASIAAGTPEDEAIAAGDRTTAAYTGA